jgi:phosphosulfolactate phosphohydrolase-like enzyme
VHNSPISCMKMNIENTFLITACANGVIAFLSIDQGKRGQLGPV